MAEARPSKLLLSAFVTAVVLTASIVVVVLVVRSRANDNQGGLNAALGSASALDELLAAAPVPSVVARDTGSRGVILDRATLKDAIAVARPRMENTVTRVDTGAALLAIWASKKLTWDALNDLPETSPLMFRKDPEAERGKRFCMSGRIEDIRAEKTLAGRLLEDRTLPLIERSPGAPAKASVPIAGPAGLSPVASGPASAQSAAAPPSRLQLEYPSITDEDWAIPDDGKVFFATLEEKPEEAKPGESALSHAASLAKRELLSIEVIAVGSTRGLVDGSEGRACGVLTGVTLPYLASGGASNIPQHRIVGMFDLPENRSGQRGETH